MYLLVLLYQLIKTSSLLPILVNRSMYIGPEKKPRNREMVDRMSAIVGKEKDCACARNSSQ